MTKVSNFSIKVSKRPVRGSYTALTDPSPGGIGPVGEDNTVDYTAWFQNPAGETNLTDPITVPFNESITAQGVPADITAVKVYWRRNNGPTRYLLDLTDVGAGNWAYVGYDAIPLNNPPHIGPPWEDIEFTAKYISPDGAVWQGWVNANVSHVNPPPTWDLPDPDVDGDFDGPFGGTIGDCVTAWTGSPLMGVYYDELSVVAPQKIVFAFDMQPPAGLTWRDLSAYSIPLMELGGIVATDTVDEPYWGTPPPTTWNNYDWVGVAHLPYLADPSAQSRVELFWLCEKYAVETEYEPFVDDANYYDGVIDSNLRQFPELGSKRVQWRVEIEGTSITISYRFPNDGAQYYLPLSDWSTWDTKSVITMQSGYVPLTDMFDVGRFCVGGGFHVPIQSGVTDADLVGEDPGVGVMQEWPFWSGAMYGWYLECDDVPIAGVNDFGNVSAVGPSAWGGETWRVLEGGIAYDFTDELGATGKLILQGASAESICFEISY